MDIKQYVKDFLHDMKVRLVNFKDKVKKAIKAKIKDFLKKLIKKL